MAYADWSWSDVPEDKQTHVEVEARIGLLFSTFFYSLPSPVAREDETRQSDRFRQRDRLFYSAGLCLLPGVAKEALDELEHQVLRVRSAGLDPLDLLADAAGCVVGITAGAVLGTTLRYTLVPSLTHDGASLTVAFRF